MNSKTVGVGAECLRQASPLLGQGGVAAPVIKYREASLGGADGVVRSTTDYAVVWTNHPVRSNQGGFATFLLMSRPPLLGQGGDCLLHARSRLLPIHSHVRTGGRFFHSY